jgi:hypothetical protein
MVGLRFTGPILLFFRKRNYFVITHIFRPECPGNCEGFDP